MSTVDNKAKVRLWFEEILRGGTSAERLREVGEQIFSPAFVDHDGPDPAHGWEALLRAVPGLLHVLPDARFTIEQLIGEGDLIAVRLRGEATHTREGRGITPTGKHLSWTENEIFRFEDGRIVESWGEGGLDAALATVGLGFSGGQRPH